MAISRSQKAKKRRHYKSVTYRRTERPTDGRTQPLIELTTKMSVKLFALIPLYMRIRQMHSAFAKMCLAAKKSLWRWLP